MKGLKEIKTKRKSKIRNQISGMRNRKGRGNIWLGIWQNTTALKC
jgi:hypothetical protein